MTVFAPDLPDWTSESSAGTLYGFDGGINAGESIDFTLNGIGSYIIRLQSNSSSNDILVGISYFITGLGGIALNTVIVTAQQSPFGPVGFQYESPSYGSGITIFNYDEDNPLYCSTVSSNRNVDQPRILNDLCPGYVFQQQLGSGFTMSVPQYLQQQGVGPNGYPANVQGTFIWDSTNNGVLEFWYKANDFSQQKIMIGTVMGGSVGQATVFLPQCVGQIVFTPAATNAVGEISVQAFPSYTG
jgi:hypothetical protein